MWESTIKRKLEIFGTCYETYQILIGGEIIWAEIPKYQLKIKYFNQEITVDKLSIIWHYTAFLLCLLVSGTFR